MGNGKTAVATLALMMALTARQAQAQGVEFSLGGGLGIPLSETDDRDKLGWHGLAGVSVVPTGWPVGIQVDGQFHQFKLEDAAQPPGFDLKDRLIFGTGNLVYKFKTSEESTFRPYLIGGGGVYNIKTTGADDLEEVLGTDNSTTKFGINAGAGFDFKAGSVGVFVEGRFHDVLVEGEDYRFIPVTLGLRFGGG